MKAAPEARPHFFHLVELYGKRFCAVILLSILTLGCAAPPPPAKEPALAGDPLQTLSEKYRREADRFEKEGDLHRSVLDWQIVRRLAPHDPKARRKIEALGARIRSEADAHFQKGLNDYRKNAMAAARKEFLTVLMYDPDHRQALEFLKDRLVEADCISYETKDGDTARKIAENIYHDPQKDFLVTYFNPVNTGERLKAGTRLKLPVIDEAVTAQPAHFDDKLKKADDLFKAKKYEEVIAFAENILQYDPTSRKASDLVNASYYALGAARLRNKQYEAALSALEHVDHTYKNAGELTASAQDHLKGEAEIHYRKAVKYFLAENLEEAIRELKKTLDLDPNHPQARKDLEKTERLLKNLNKLR